MSWKWVVVNSIGVLFFLLMGTASSQEKSDNTQAALSIIVGFILDSEEQNSAEFEANSEPVSFQVPGINLNSVSVCNASQELPSGLSLRVNDDQTGCEIFGIPTQAFSPTSITITATDNLSNEVSSTLTVSVNGASVISGLITYDRVPVSISLGLDFANTRQEPVRGATVELLDSGANIVQTTTTDSDGLYSFEVSSNELRRVRVKAETIQVSATAANYNVAVVDNTNSGALYSLTEAQAASVTSKPVRNLNAGSGWSIAANSYTGTRAAGPFAILDSIFTAMDKVITVDPDVVFPPLLANWSINNSISAPLTGESVAQARAAGRIGTSFYIPSELSLFDTNAGELFLVGAITSDTDEFDRHIVIHEWGHYFEDRLSRSDSIGGSHSSGDRLDLRLAFSEGFSNALSAIVTDDSLYVDTSSFFTINTSFGFNIENNDVINPGWYSESSIQSILFDLYDNENDGVDQLSVGFSPIYEAMISPDHAGTDAFTSIYSFAFAFIESSIGSNFNINRAFDNLLAGQSIEDFVLTQFGSNFESNLAGLSSFNFDDLYSSVSITPNTAVTFADIDAERVCTTTEFIGADGQTNKLFNSAFAQVDIPIAGNYLITVVENNFFIADEAYDSTLPSVSLHKNGEFLGVADSNMEGLLVLPFDFFEPGVFIIEVFDQNIERNVGFTGQACFDVGVIAP